MSIRQQVLKALSRVMWHAGLTARLCSSKKGHLVLMYHSINGHGTDSQYSFSTTAIQFEAHLQFLRRWAQIVPLSEVATDISERRTPDGLKIAITFDDGYRDNFTTAYPILCRYSVPATIFLVTSLLSETPTSFLSWSDIHEMQRSGLIDFGAHTHRHLCLTSLKLADVQMELKTCKYVMEDKLGQTVTTFSYPFGGYNTEVRNSVQSCGFRVALLDHLMLNGGDLLSLGRMSVDKTNEDIPLFALFVAKATVHP